MHGHHGENGPRRMKGTPIKCDFFFPIIFLCFVISKKGTFSAGWVNGRLQSVYESNRMTRMTERVLAKSLRHNHNHRLYRYTRLTPLNIDFWMKNWFINIANHTDSFRNPYKSEFLYVMCGKCLHCVGDVVRWYHIRSPTPTRLVWSCLFFLALISNTNYNSASVAQWHPQWTVTKHIPTWAVVSDCQPLVDSQASPALLALQASTLVPTYVLKVNWYKNIHFCCCCCVNSSGAGKECDWGGWEKLHKNILWTEEKKTKKKGRSPLNLRVGWMVQ